MNKTLKKSVNRNLALPDGDHWAVASRALTHWGRVTHICVGKLTNIGSDNGLSPDRRQAIIWTNAGFLLIGPLGTNFSEILIEILTFSFKKMRLKVSSAKRRPFCLGLNVLKKRCSFGQSARSIESICLHVGQISCYFESRTSNFCHWFSSIC